MGSGQSGDQTLIECGYVELSHLTWMALWTQRQAGVRPAGLRWLEFSVVAVVLSVFAGSLLTALLYYEELGEAAVVQLTVYNIRSGLRYQIADRIVQGRAWDMGELLRANPMSWVASSPDGYVGSVRNADIASLPKGSWFYDIDRAELGYVPKLTFHLAVESGEPLPLRWRMTALRFDVPWEVEGVMLVSVNPYRWF
jgi:hypothetical protein